MAASACASSIVCTVAAAPAVAGVLTHEVNQGRAGQARAVVLAGPSSRFAAPGCIPQPAMTPQCDEPGPRPPWRRALLAPLVVPAKYDEANP